MNADRPNEPPEDACPPRLAEALRALREECLFVPPQVDEQILEEARRRLGSERPMIRLWATGRWLAVAASLVLAGWLIHTQLQPRRPRQSVAVEDIDHSGRVDILDAFKLARLMAAGEAAQFDLNQDGRVDQLDIDAVAARAVRLEGGS